MSVRLVSIENPNYHLRTCVTCGRGFQPEAYIHQAEDEQGRAIGSYCDECDREGKDFLFPRLNGLVSAAALAESAVAPTQTVELPAEPLRDVEEACVVSDIKGPTQEPADPAQPIEITPNMIAFYQRLGTLKQEEGVVIGGNKSISDRLKMDYRTVKRFLPALKSNGWLQIEMNDQGQYRIKPMHELTAKERATAKRVLERRA